MSTYGAPASRFTMRWPMPKRWRYSIPCISFIAHNRRTAMTVDWQHFTPYSALAGGANHRLRRGGATAAVQRPDRRHQRHYRRCIECRWPGGRAGAPHLLARLLLSLAVCCHAAALPPGEIAVGNGGAGGMRVLVGLGTRLGSGCTSGHGVCGVARLARRPNRPGDVYAAGLP